MFLKPFKIKSNVQLKGSDGKKLRAKIQRDYPNVADTDLSSLVPNKSTITQIKLIVHAGSNCSVYAVDKRPMFFEDENEKLVPTIYALWLVPTLVPYFTTLPAVLPRLGNGADLMLPGVIRQGTGLGAYGHYKKDEIVAVNLTTNKAAVGVGKLARSSDDLYMSGGQGPCVKMLHVFGDKLWSIDPAVVLQIPQCDAVMDVPKDDDFPALGATPRKKTPASENKVNIASEVIEREIVQKIDELQLDAEGNIAAPNEDVNHEIAPEGEASSEVSMDTVLYNAFLTALKTDIKNLALPLLTSNFYRVHVLPAAERPIDLKQTSYKKFSKFLNEMVDKGFLVVREESKGVEKIISIDIEHPDLINFIPKVISNNSEEDAKAQLFHATMTELYTVTDETIAFFTKLNYKNGEGIPTAEIKKVLKQYISKNQLPYVGDTKQIQLDPTLRDICGQDSAIFGDIYQTLLSKMHYTYAMRGKNEVSSNKPPIQMTLATRSGNKKVTLVSNLEAYGIIVSEFAKACKLGAAASTSLIKSPHQKQEQLQVQGNQVKFIHNLLTETYKIPPKQIQGLDLAKKEKKKK